YDKLRTSEDEISKLNSQKLKPIYVKYYNDIKNSANELWGRVGKDLKNGLELNASRLENRSNPDAGYAEAKKTHEKIVEICSWLNDNNGVETHKYKIKEMDYKIIEAISNANALKNETSKIHEDINNSTLSFLGTGLIKNPSKILNILNKYGIMFDNYKIILKEYQLGGDHKGIDDTHKELAILEKEFERFKPVNIAYIFLLGSILIQTTRKSIQGLFKYRADTNDVRLSEIARLKRIS
ncbi:MAG: hypothetical protein OIN88_05525, partial [Candidatus Methanoperedens sp.]|nr:hypothetical protein [Candidatus Methanoperedens sp.]